MFKKVMKIFNLSICAILIPQLIGCGTILYPERRGQKAGHLDVGVVLLDGIGLLFFLIPGVIAFAVDFSNGSIYLPGTSRGSLDIKDMKQVKFDPKQSSIESIEKLLREEIGREVRLNQTNMKISRLESADEMIEQFKQVLPGIENNRLAHHQ